MDVPQCALIGNGSGQLGEGCVKKDPDTKDLVSASSNLLTERNRELRDEQEQSCITDNEVRSSSECLVQGDSSVETIGENICMLKLSIEEKMAYMYSKVHLAKERLINMKIELERIITTVQNVRYTIESLGNATEVENKNSHVDEKDLEEPLG